MAFIISILYVIIIMCISCAVYTRTQDNFLIRKMIHIGMASWWFIRLYFIDCKLLWLGPAFFILINLILSMKLGYDKGIVYFAISLTGLTALSAIHFEFIFPSTAATLVLGYADSIAAILGRNRQIRKNLEYRKSAYGSFIFVIVSFAVLVVVCRFYYMRVSIIVLLFISIISAFSEAKIFPQFDNIVVPVVVFGALCII